MSLHTNTPSTFQNASKDRPCPICSGTDWCWIKLNTKNEVTLVGCRRVGDDVRTDSSGWEYFLHKVGADDDRGDAEIVRAPRVEPTNADLDLRHAVYSAFLSTLKLTGGHETSLMKRGFTKAEITKHGYRSMPVRLDDVTRALDAAVAVIKEKFPDTWKAAAPTVPGFYIREVRDNPKPRLERELQAAHDANDKDEIERVRKEYERADYFEAKLLDEVFDMVRIEGTVIPLRDRPGRIHSLQVRLDEAFDDNNKYRLFSTPKRGVGAAAQPHIPVHEGSSFESVRFVEGAFKADMATLKKGLTVSYPSAGAWRQCLPVIKAMGIKKVILAFDADVRTNKSVASAMARFAVQLATDQVEFEIETWEPDHGKGIDDVIANGHEGDIVTRRGRDAWDFIANFITSSGAAPSPEVLANKVLSNLVDRAAKDQTILFENLSIQAAAWLPDGPRYRRLLEGLKAAGVALTEWKRAVEKQRKEFTNKTKEQKAVKAGKRIFERGDHTEMGIALLDALADRDSKGKLRHESLVFDEGALHVFDRSVGIWRQVKDKEETLIVQGFAGSPKMDGAILSINLKDEQGAIKLAHRRVKGENFFANAAVGFAFKNGFVDVSSKGAELRDHRLDDKARFKFDFDYRPTHPNEWYRFLAGVFRDDEDGLDRMSFLQEFLGACLVGVAPKLVGMVLVLMGEGNNGKSKLAQIIEACFPDGAVCSLAPQRWREDYHVGQLAGKRLNIVGELPSRELQDSEIFKLVVTGEQKVRARSPFKEPFEFFAIAGHLCLAQKPPATNDHSLGYWRRLAVMPMSRIFTEVDEDKDIVDKVLHDKPAIVAWMIEGAVRVLQRGRICSPPASSDRAKAEWQMEADPVRRFISKRTEIETGSDMISLEGLYSSWKTWAEAKGHTKGMSENTLAGRVKSIMIDMARKQGPLFETLTTKQREQLLREGHIHTKKGNRYPLRMKDVEDVITEGELAGLIDASEIANQADVIPIDKARSKSA